MEVLGDSGGAVAVDGPTAVGVGAYEVAVGRPRSLRDPGDGGWWVANRGDRRVSLERVRQVWRLVDPPRGLRMFVNGFQSWSRAAVAVVGADPDPSLVKGSIPTTRGPYLGEQEPTGPGELRSEMVTVMGSVSGPFHLAGFLAGTGHDGTVRLRRGSDGLELVVEARIGGACLEPGERRALHPVVMDSGDEAPVLLERWAGVVGESGGALVGDPYQVGWCSWYQYFSGITEAELRRNLALAGEWPFEVFQLDDGYQSQVGDWLSTSDAFPSDLESLASEISGAGFRPGIWIAPFLVAPDSELAHRHPEWLVGEKGSTGPLATWLNPEWGGVMWGLDTSNPDVLRHIEGLARSLVDAGFTYLKLDFTFSPALAGRYADPSMTPAQRVRAGFGAIREGAGAGAFLLGCGAPLGPCVGLVNGMRIGADVAPSWDLAGPALPGLEDTAPATRHAHRNTLTRAFMHRRLWLNDPDCLMLRAEQTEMTEVARRTWARTVGVSGGMAVVSDDLALLGPDERRLLDEVLEMGRESDAGAAAGRPARCDDLMEGSWPRRLVSVARRLDTDPETARSALERD